MSLAAMVGKLLLREVSANLLDDYVQRNDIQIETSGTIGWCSTKPLELASLYHRHR